MNTKITISYPSSLAIIALVILVLQEGTYSGEPKSKGEIIDVYSGLKFLTKESFELYLTEERAKSVAGAYIKPGISIEWNGETYRARFIEYQIKRNLPASQDEAIALTGLMNKPDPVCFCAALALEHYLSDGRIINPTWVWEVGINRKEYIAGLKHRISKSKGAQR